MALGRDESHDTASHKVDPMGVRRRWGRRELILVICALVAVGAAYAASSSFHTHPSVAAAPLGAIPLSRAPMPTGATIPAR